MITDVKNTIINKLLNTLSEDQAKDLKDKVKNLRDRIIEKFNSNSSYNNQYRIYDIEEINELFRKKNKDLSRIVIYKENDDKGSVFEKKRLLFPIVYRPYYEEFGAEDEDLNKISKENISKIGLIIENKEYIIKIPKRRNDPYEGSLELRTKIPEGVMVYPKEGNNVIPDLKITEARPYKNTKDIKEYLDILKNKDKTSVLYEVPFPFLNKLYDYENNILYSSRLYNGVQPYVKLYIFGSMSYYIKPQYFDLKNITQLVLSEISGRTLTSALLLGFNDEKTIIDFDKSYLDILDGISIKKEEFKDRLDTILSYGIIRTSYLGYIPSDLALYQLAFRGKVITIDMVSTDALKIGKNGIIDSHVKDWILNPSIRYGVIGQLYDDLIGHSGSGKIISHLIEEGDYLVYRKDKNNKYISDIVDEVIKKNKDEYKKLIKEYQNTDMIITLDEILYYSIDAYLNTLAKI